CDSTAYSHDLSCHSECKVYMPSATLILRLSVYCECRGPYGDLIRTSLGSLEAVCHGWNVFHEWTWRSCRSPSLSLSSLSLLSLSLSFSSSLSLYLFLSYFLSLFLPLSLSLSL